VLRLAKHCTFNLTIGNLYVCFFCAVLLLFLFLLFYCLLFSLLCIYSTYGFSLIILIIVFTLKYVNCVFSVYIHTYISLYIYIYYMCVYILSLFVVDLHSLTSASKYIKLVGLIRIRLDYKRNH